MTTAIPREPPESRGPAIVGPDGEPVYGVPSSVRTFVPPPRSQEEREADRAARASTARCSRCAELPDDLVAAFARAVRAVKEGRPVS